MGSDQSRIYRLRWWLGRERSRNGIGLYKIDLLVGRFAAWWRG